MVKILAACLKQHPYLNASLEEDKIKFWEEINIGIATALNEGLVVPVIHNADKMTLNEIGTQVTQLSQKAKSWRIDFTKHTLVDPSRYQIWACMVSTLLLQS